MQKSGARFPVGRLTHLEQGVADGPLHRGGALSVNPAFVLEFDVTFGGAIVLRLIPNPPQ